MKKSLGADTLALPTPVWVVGAYDKEGKPNAMTAAWGGICCSKPPCLSVSLRKATYTYGCIVERKAFTVSVPSEEHLAATDFFGMASGKNTNKFKAAGLTPQKAEHVDAPFVDEFPLILECALIHTLEIGLHTLFVGEIRDVKAEESCLDEKGNPDPALVRPVTYGPGSRKYMGLGSFLGQGHSLGKALMGKE